MISVGSCARSEKKVSFDESASERERGLRKEEVLELNSLREAAVDRPGWNSKQVSSVTTEKEERLEIHLSSSSKSSLHRRCCGWESKESRGEIKLTQTASRATVV